MANNETQGSGPAVTVRARLLDPRGVPWHAHAVFAAAAVGSIDLTRQAPVSGTDAGVDGEGLTASLATTVNGPSRTLDNSSIAPVLVEFTAEVGSHHVVAAQVRRLYVAAGVQTTARRDGELSGLFFQPLGGEARPGLIIPVEKTNSPILLVSGDDDRMWPSAKIGDQIIERLEASRHPFRSRHCRYPRAGHLMRSPGASTSVLQNAFAFGGDGPAQAAANRAAWTETLGFLRGSLDLDMRTSGAALIGAQRS